LLAMAPASRREYRPSGDADLTRGSRNREPVCVARPAAAMDSGATPPSTRTPGPS